MVVVTAVLSLCGVVNAAVGAVVFAVVVAVGGYGSVNAWTLKYGRRRQDISFCSDAGRISLFFTFFMMTT